MYRVGILTPSLTSKPDTFHVLHSSIVVIWSKPDAVSLGNSPCTVFGGSKIGLSVACVHSDQRETIYFFLSELKVGFSSATTLARGQNLSHHSISLG